MVLSPPPAAPASGWTLPRLRALILLVARLACLRLPFHILRILIPVVRRGVLLSLRLRVAVVALLLIVTGLRWCSGVAAVGGRLRFRHGRPATAGILRPASVGILFIHRAVFCGIHVARLGLDDRA